MSPVWNKLIVSGSDAELSKLTVTNVTASAVTGSFRGDGSQLTGIIATSSSYAVTASVVLSYPAFTFDGGTPSTNFTSGPIFDLGGVT